MKPTKNGKTKGRKMYEQVETQHIAKWETGSTFKPISTLKDGYGGTVHITTDDGCYVIAIERKSGCISTSWIFPEAFEVLKTLPSLPIK